PRRALPRPDLVRRRALPLLDAPRRRPARARLRASPHAALHDQLTARPARPGEDRGVRRAAAAAGDEPGRPRPRRRAARRPRPARRRRAADDAGALLAALGSPRVRPARPRRAPLPRAPLRPWDGTA